jgi:hypothetical protein
VLGHELEQAGSLAAKVAMSGFRESSDRDAEGSRVFREFLPNRRRANGANGVGAF